LDQIIATIDTLRRDTEAIFNLPPPVKSAEKKSEETTAEKKTEADAEMKNEEPKEEAK